MHFLDFPSRGALASLGCISFAYIEVGLLSRWVFGYGVRRLGLP